MIWPVWLLLTVWAAIVGVASYEIRSWWARPVGQPVVANRPWTTAALKVFDEVLKHAYPATDVVTVNGGADLPSQRRPPWWKPRARNRWARRIDASIAFSRVYGWKRPWSEVTKEPGTLKPRVAPVGGPS